MYPQVVVQASLGLVFGAGYGTTCAIAAGQHPTADAIFQQLLQEADSGSLKRGLQAGLEAPRAECDRPVGEPNAPPDAIIVIEKVEAGTGCLYGQQNFWVEVTWRTVAHRSGRVLNKAFTRQQRESSRTVEDWLGHPTEARAEIELVLEEIGQMMARLFTDKDQPHRISAGGVLSRSAGTGNPYRRWK